MSISLPRYEVEQRQRAIKRTYDDDGRRGSRDGVPIKRSSDRGGGRPEVRRERDDNRRWDRITPICSGRKIYCVDWCFTEAMGVSTLEIPVKEMDLLVNPLRREQWTIDLGSRWVFLATVSGCQAKIWLYRYECVDVIIFQHLQMVCLGRISLLISSLS